MLWCCTQYGSKFGKLSSSLRTWIFIPIPKKGNAKECSNYHTIALTSHAGKVMLKILQAKLQQNMNQEIPDVQAGFQRGTRDQIAMTDGSWRKQRSSRKNIYFFIDYVKASDCVDHNKMWKILRDGNTRPPCLSPKKPVCRSRSNRTGHGTTDWFQIEKGV